MAIFPLESAAASSFSIVCMLFGLSLCYLVGLAIYRVYLHPLAAYPGPKSSAITRLPYLWNHVNGRQNHFIRALHERYGEVVRIAPDELSYTSSQALKDIYGHRHGKPEMSKNQKLYTQHPGGQHIGTAATREDHSRFRRGLSNGFSDSSMRQQEPLIQGYINLLLQRLEEHSEGGTKPQELCSWFNWTTFDIIGDLTFGEPFGCLQNSDYHPWVSIIFDTTKAGILLQTISGYIPFGKRLAPLLVSKALLQKKKTYHQITVEKVTYRTQLTEQRADFLGNVMKRKEHSFTFPELTSNASILVVAGSETTATMLSGMVYLLLTHQDSLAKAMNEVRSSFASLDEITINSTTGLKFLIACIEEGLRFYPPAPAGFSRIVPSGGDFISGKWVAGGTIAGYHIISAHHSPHNFRDPDSYRPQRFLKDPYFANDDMNALAPFSFGPRNCIGKNLAWSELRLILAKLLFNFDWELAPGSEDWLDQLTFIIWDKGPLNVKLKKRVLTAAQ